MIDIVIWTQVGRQHVLKALENFDNVAVTVANSRAEFVGALGKAQVAVTVGTPDVYSADVAARVSESSTLRWIHLMSAGYEGVAQNGLPENRLLTGPGEGVSTAVAEHALALLWALARGLPAALRQQMSQQWDSTFAADTITLHGKTLLVVGFGKVGRKIAALAQAIGMYVIAISRSAKPHESAHEVHAVSDLACLLPRADAIVSALPLSSTTRGLFDQHTLLRCRPGALFVNVGRGGTVDQEALLAALTQRRLKAAALDVTTPEPLPSGDPLWSAERLLLTPHMAGAGDPKAICAIAEEFGSNLRRFIDGEPLRNLIDHQDFHPI